MAENTDAIASLAAAAAIIAVPVPLLGVADDLLGLEAWMAMKLRVSIAETSTVDDHSR